MRKGRCVSFQDFKSATIHHFNIFEIVQVFLLNYAQRLGKLSVTQIQENICEPCELSLVIWMAIRRQLRSGYHVKDHTKDYIHYQNVEKT